MTKTKAVTLFLALFALAVMLPSGLFADTITIGVQSAGADCGAGTGNIFTAASSTTGSATFAGSCGTFTISSANGTGSPIVPEPTLLTQTIDATANGSGTLKIYVTEQGLSFPTPSGLLLSGFTSNLFFGPATSVDEQTFIDTGNGLFGGTPLASATFTGIGATSSLDLATTGSGPFSETAVYTITAAGSGAAFNDTINISLPEPASLSMVGFGLLGLGTGLRKKLLNKKLLKL